MKEADNSSVVWSGLMNKGDHPYEAIIGYNKPICNGRIICNSVGDKYIYGTIICIVVPYSLLVVFNGREIRTAMGATVLIVLGLCSIFSLYYLLRTWLTEPGILMKSVDKKNDPNVVSTIIERRVSGLMVSIKSNRLDYITKTLEVAPGLIKETNSEGKTLLHISCLFNKPDIAKYLLEHNADIMHKDAYGLNAIHYAAFLNNDDVTHVLLQHLGNKEEFDVLKKQYIDEVLHTIPQYNYVDNMYFISRDGITHSSPNIIDFYRPSSLSNNRPPQIHSTQSFQPAESDPAAESDCLVTPLLSNANSRRTTLSSLVDGLTVPSNTTNASPSPASLSNRRFHHYPCIINHRLCSSEFCSICHIYMPPRTYHCRMCNVCIRGFDHHCPWVSNCVGLRNHPYFVWFLIFSEAQCIFGILAMTGYFIIQLISQIDNKQHIDIMMLLLHSWACLVYMIACLGFFAPLLYLLVYHFKLIKYNATTHEEVSVNYDSFKEGDNINDLFPYNQGLKQNIITNLFTPTPPSCVQIEPV